MHRKLKKSELFQGWVQYLFSAGIIVFLAFLSLAGPLDAAERGLSRWSEVPRSAMAGDGWARVLVEFDVPDIDRMTRASTRWLPLVEANQPGQGVRSALAAADATLAAAVAVVGDKVLDGLVSAGHRLNRMYRYVPMMALEIDQRSLEALRADQRVRAIFPDVLYPLPDVIVDEPWVPLDDAAQQESGPDRPGMAETIGLISADQAWERGYTGAGWHVAVLDTGIRASHEFFRGKDIVEACFSLVAHCPNGSTSMFGAGSAAHHPDTYAGYDHGTHVSGTAVGRKPDGLLSGVARDADLIAVNVFSRVGGGVGAYRSDVLAGLEYVYSLRVRYSIGAVNMSLGGGRFTDFCDDDVRRPIIDLLRSVNIPTTIASGNNGWCGALGAPACITSGIAVMASSKEDQETAFNNWHAGVADLFAPGASIRSATGKEDDSYANWSGTSMAAPHVAGAMTLVRQFNPTGTVRENFVQITAQAPLISTLCPDAGVKPRLDVNNFFVPEGRWVTEIGIVNPNERPLTGILRGFDTTGLEIWHLPVDLAAHARLELNVAEAVGKTALRIGYMRLDITDGKGVGYLKFMQPGKYRVGLEALPKANQATLFLPHVHSDSDWWTGIALVNSTEQWKTLDFSFSNGARGELSLPPSAHQAFLADQFLGPNAFEGSATVGDGQGIAGLLLFGSTVSNQLSGVGLGDMTARRLIFPHVDETNGWWTGFAVYNPNPHTASLSLYAYNAMGGPVQEQPVFFEIPPYSRHTATTNMPEASWFLVESTLPVTGFELFGQMVHSQLAGFSVVELATSSGIFPKIESTGWTGIAVVNPGRTPATVRFEARNNAGILVAERSMTLGARKKLVELVQNVFPEHDLTVAKYVRFVSDQELVGFQLNGSSDNIMLDAIPALGGKANLGEEQLFFPHVHAQ